MNNHLINKSFLLLLIVFNATLTYCQINQGGTPFSFNDNDNRLSKKNIAPLEKIPIIEMPSIDENVIDEIKKNNESKNNRFQYAYPFDVDIDIKRSSLREPLIDGILYRLAIKSKDAISLNLIFKKYNLPKGAKLYIYSKDKVKVIGAFTNENNNPSSILPTEPINGDEIIVEYYEPNNTDIKGELIVGNVNHDIYGILKAGTASASGVCEIDVNCPEGNDWQNDKRAVVKLLIGPAACTGTLLNNTNVDGKPYVLTANHCIDDLNYVPTILFVFNDEKISCNSPNSFGTSSISGATLRATRNYYSNEQDFALLEMSSSPSPSINPYFAGWDNTDVAKDSVVGIHHPGGGSKKISLENHLITSQIFRNSPDQHFWKVNHWEKGVTEPGSSGSALFDKYHRVIGDLTGGFSSCGGNTDGSNIVGIDYYSKLSRSWDDAQSSNRRLKDWLDPLNSNATVINGAYYCPSSIVRSMNITSIINTNPLQEYKVTRTITANNNIKPSTNVNYLAGQSITLNPGFFAESGTNTLAMIMDFNCISTTNTNKMATSSGTDNISQDNKAIIDENLIQNYDFSILPNPSNGMFTLKINSNEITNYSIEIINLQGISVFKMDEIKENSILIDKTDLPKGIYFVKLNNGNEEITKKLIIE